MVGERRCSVCSILATRKRGREFRLGFCVAILARTTSFWVFIIRRYDMVILQDVEEPTPVSSAQLETDC